MGAIIQFNKKIYKNNACKDRTPQMRYEISSAIFQERETAASIAFT